ncbi:hypothetical protein [Magnetofaba australis]|uniref:hypothetical protein n=1 Tax=Magnetofaba australis TaxID=1472297 RepID=UPI001180C158|nr:hypothetical protein [Magnetofaba australis]
MIVLAAALPLIMLQPQARDMALGQLQQQLHWRIHIEEFDLYWGRLDMRSVSAISHGTDIEAALLRVEWSLHDLFSGRLSNFQLYDPVVSIVPTSSNNDSASAQKANWRKAPMALPFALRTFQIRNGLIQLKSKRNQTQWKLTRIEAYGDDLDEGQGEVIFAGQGDPGGVITAQVVWSREQVMLNIDAEDAPLAPLGALVGAPLDAGYLSTHMEITLGPNIPFEASGRLRVKNAHSAGGWNADGELFLHAGRRNVEWTGAVLVGSPYAGKEDLLLTGVVAYDKGLWVLQESEVKLAGLGRLELNGRWEAGLHLDATLISVAPMELAKWLGAPASEELRLRTHKPWRLHVVAQGDPRAPEWQASLKSGPDVIHSDQLRAQDVNVSLQLNGRGAELGDRARVELSAAHLKYHKAEAIEMLWHGEVDLSEENEESLEAHLLGKWRVRTGNGAYQSMGVSMDARLDGLAVSTLGAEVTVADGGMIHIAHRKLRKYISWVFTAEPKKPLEISLVGALLDRNLGSGDLSGKLEFLQRHIPGSHWEGQFSWGLRNGRWSQPARGDAPEVIAQGVNAAGDGNFSWAEQVKSYRVSTSMRVEKGEWLADGWYGDLGAEEPQAIANISLLPDGALSGRLRVMARSIEKLTLQSRNWRDPKAAGVTAKLNQLRLEPLFKTYLQDRWALVNPQWRQAKMVGQVDGEVTLNWPGEAMRLEGSLSLRDGYIVGPGQEWRLENVSLDLPIYTDLAPPKLPRDPGALNIERVIWRQEPIALMGLKPIVEGRLLRLGEQVELDLLGGGVKLSNVQVEFPQTESPAQARFGLTGRDLNLTRVSHALQLTKPMEGKAFLEFPRVTLSQWGVGKFQGEAGLQMYGGIVSLRNIWARNVTQPTPEWGMDVQVSQLDLGRVSAALGVGAMHGTLSGEVEDLAMAGAEPVSFDASFGSVESNTQQVISVDAINDLNMLGGGGVNAITQGLLSAFNNYRYRRIGIRCRLKNDRFHLSGLGGAERQHLLVEGSYIPPRVDVVSHNSVIGWKDMVERLDRIFERAAERQKEE